MNLTRMLAVARKEFIHVRRDKLSLGLALAIPALMIVLFGYALTLDVDNVPLAVWDQSHTPASREYISRFTGSRYFSLKKDVDSYRQIDQAIDRSDVLAALVIPVDFESRLDAGFSTQVQMIIDGSDSNTATIALGYADLVTSDFSRQIVFQYVRRTLGRTLDPPLDVRPRVWFNTDMESKNYIVPGLIAVIMMIIAALLTSLTVAREWEYGTMEQLISTPVTPTELVVGKLLPYFGIGMLDMALAVMMGQFLFDVPFRGSVALMFALAGVFLAGVLSLGMLISIAAKNQLLASQMAILLTFVPSYLLSGFMFSIANMPRAIQGVTYLIPARYFIAILKGIYLKGVGLDVLGLPAVLMVIFGVATTALAIRKFKKKLG